MLVLWFGRLKPEQLNLRKRKRVRDPTQHTGDVSSVTRLPAAPQTHTGAGAPGCPGAVRPFPAGSSPEGPPAPASPPPSPPKFSSCNPPALPRHKRWEEVASHTFLLGGKLKCFHFCLFLMFFLIYKETHKSEPAAGTLLLPAPQN